jgi:putative addiction module CopG family antidote
MTITLTDELEELINAKIRGGPYKTPDEVILASLRLLEAKEEGITALRREILRGVQDIEKGRFASFTTDTELEEFAEEIIKQGQKRQNVPAKS